jgi:hypothetical protein
MASLTRGEGIGLGLAVVGHVALAYVLAMQPAEERHKMQPRMQVNLVDEVALKAESTSREEAALDRAPTLGEAQPAPQAAPQPAPPQPVTPPVPQPVPQPKPVPQPAPPKPQPAPPKPAPAPPKPAPAPPKPQPAPPKPVPAPAKPQPAPPKPQPAPAKAPPAKSDPIGAIIAKSAAANPHANAPAKTKAEGSSRIGSDFLKGVTSNTGGKAQTPPAPTIGPQVKGALVGAMSRQLKPYWRVPQGVDTEQLVTVLAFDLNIDGTLAGPITVVRQEGVTPSNRPQAGLHRENAIRAVKLAAPFPLPPDYYDAWKHVQFEFNRKLSQ